MILMFGDLQFFHHTFLAHIIRRLHLPGCAGVPGNMSLIKYAKSKDMVMFITHF